MKIKVERRHIENGLVGDCDRCPLALAMRDAGMRRPAVGLMTCEWTEGETRKVGRMDMDTAFFIRAFDDEETMVHFDLGDPPRHLRAVHGDH